MRRFRTMNALLIKQHLLNTAVGPMLLRARDQWRLVQMASRADETLGMAVNDVLASRLLIGMVRGGTTFVDIGAHIGSVMSQVHHAAPLAKIVAFEAMPDKVELLRQRFTYATIHSCALGESTSEATFYVYPSESGYSSLSPNIDAAEQRRYAGRTTIRVPVRKADDLLEGVNDIDVMKIDVEGAELGVLRGAARTVKRCEPLLMFESVSNTDQGLGYTAQALYEWCADHGMDVVLPSRLAHDGDGLTMGAFVHGHTYPRLTTNYFAVPHTRRAEFRERARHILGVPHLA